MIELGQDGVPGAVGPAEAVEQDQRLGHLPYLSHERSSRHLPPAARLRRRAAPLRRRGRVHLARIALDAAGPEPRARRPDPGHLARRRALGGASSRSASPRRPAAPRSWPARPGPRPPTTLPAVIEAAEARRPADRPDRRPPAGAARRRRRADDRPDQAVRVGGEVVLRGRHARRDARRGCAGCASSPAARMRTALERPPRAGAPQRRRCASRSCSTRRSTARRAAAAARTARRGLRATGRAAGSRAAASRGCGARAGGRGRDRRRARRARRRPRPRALAEALAGRCWPTRCRARARGGARDRPLRRAAARRRFGGDRRARPACCASATCRPPSRCASGWPALATTCRRSRSTPSGAWPGPRRRVADALLALEPAGAGRARSTSRRAAGRRLAAGAGARPTPARRPRSTRRSAPTMSTSRASPASWRAPCPPARPSSIAASMPIRDVETFWPVLDDAAARAGQPRRQRHRRHDLHRLRRRRRGRRPDRLLLGDVALAHDVGGAAGRPAARRSPLTIVVVDNAGGGIFDFLPVATKATTTRSTC